MTAVRSPGLFRVALALAAAALLTGAAGTHASKQDLQECRSQAEQGAGSGQAAGAHDPAPGDAGLMERMAACMKSKGYVPVEDVSGVCETFSLPQCFERTDDE